MDNVKIESIACIGSGIIGTNWATHFAVNGIYVNIQDKGVLMLERARSRIISNLEYLYMNGVVTMEQYKKANGYIRCTMDLESAVSDVQLIQESFPGEYGLKKNLIEEVEKYSDKDTIYASSSSSLSVSRLQRYSKRPGNMIVSKFVYPTYLVPLVEIEEGKASKGTMKNIMGFYKSMGFEVSLK